MNGELYFIDGRNAMDGIGLCMDAFTGIIEHGKDVFFIQSVCHGVKLRFIRTGIELAGIDLTLDRLIDLLKRILVLDQVQRLTYNVPLFFFYRFAVAEGIDKFI